MVMTSEWAGRFGNNRGWSRSTAKQDNGVCKGKYKVATHTARCWFAWILAAHVS